MQFLSAHTDFPAQVKSLVEQLERLRLRPFVGFLFTDKDFQLTRQQSANRRRTPRRNDLCLVNRSTVETDGKVLLSVVLARGKPIS